MILLLTHSQDSYTIDRVMEHLRRRGLEHLRLHTDFLPFFQPLTMHFSGGQADAVKLEFDNGPWEFSPGDVRAVWNRRLWPAAFPADFPPEFAARCAPAAQTAVLDLLELCREARWLNPLRAAQKAESKVAQLSCAARRDLRFPPTLISNNPREIEAFFHLHDGRVITKLLLPQAVSMEGHPDFAYTCLVQPEHLQQLEHARAQPQIFQPFLSKVREYRAVGVGQRFFVGALEVPPDGPLAVDWRQARPEDGLCWQKATLSAATQEKLWGMMAEFGLPFAVFDLVDTGEGEPFFLEMNPAGEWGMLERDLGLPISEAIAEWLAE